MSTFDPKRVEEEIAKHKDRFLDALEAAVAAKLRGLSPCNSLTLRLTVGENTRREIAPGASLEYVRALLAFMKGREFDGCQVDSAVTPVVLDVVEKEVVAFYSSKDVTDEIVAAIVGQVQAVSDVDGVIRSEVQGNVDWLRREYTAAMVESSFSLSGTLIDASAHQIQEFLSSAAGKLIVGAIGQAAATSAGKIALERVLVAVVHKVMASSALKSAIVTTVKKVGIGILIKTAVGKALVALLAAVGIAHVPIAWIILPVIGAFLVHEYHAFPNKLAKKVPSEIRYAMSSRFGDLNEKITMAAIRAIFATLEKEMIKVRIPEGGG